MQLQINLQGSKPGCDVQAEAHIMSDDSILARLSAGEFECDAAVVKKYGIELLDMINNAQHKVTMAKVKRIQIEVDVMGKGSIVIDGHDISAMVEGVNIRTRAGKFTSCVLMLCPDMVSVNAECEVKNHSSTEKVDHGKA
jgi:hypothetical protein